MIKEDRVSAVLSSRFDSPGGVNSGKQSMHANTLYLRRRSMKQDAVLRRKEDCFLFIFVIFYKTVTEHLIKL